jgi:hypothetical protein
MEHPIVKRKANRKDDPLYGLNRRVALHHLTNRASDEAARFLAGHLNATEPVYPGTNLRLVYKLVSD